MNKTVLYPHRFSYATIWTTALILSANGALLAREPLPRHLPLPQKQQPRFTQQAAASQNQQADMLTLTPGQSRVHEVQVASPTDNTAGFQIELRLQNPRSLDAELQLFDVDPEIRTENGSFPNPICVDAMPGAVKRCRVRRSLLQVRDDDKVLDKRRAWIRVVPRQGNGETGYTYDKELRILAGPVIGNTTLYADDRQKTEDGTDSPNGGFEIAQYPFADPLEYQNLHRVPVKGTHAVLNLDVRGPGVLSIAAYAPRRGSTAGDAALLVSSTKSTANQQKLLVPIPQNPPKEVFVVIRSDSLISEPISYTIDVSWMKAGWTKEVAGGYVFTLDAATQQKEEATIYDQLAEFGRRDFADPAHSDDCSKERIYKDAYAFLRETVWGKPKPSSEENASSHNEDEEDNRTNVKQDPTEPFVVFLGIDGLSKVLLVERRGDCFRRANSDSLRIMGKDRIFWAVYIEDARAQYETSIDVRFRRRSDRIDTDDLEQPGSRQIFGSSGESRLIRIGMKRFRVRSVPSALEVTFTREGKDYPKRGWSRNYGVLDRRPLWWSYGMFIPVNSNSVSVNRIALDPLVTGFTPEPEYAVIRQEQNVKHIFATLMLIYPRLRSRVKEKSNWFCGWGLVPSLSAGVGLPTGGGLSGLAYYMGAEWPVGKQDVFRFAVGASAIRQQIEDIEQSSVPIDTDIDDFTRSIWRYNFTIGLGVDLGSIVAMVY